MLGALRGCGVRGSEPGAGPGAWQSSIYGLLFPSQKAGFSGLSFFPPEMLHQSDKKCKESVFTANQRDYSRKATMLKRSIRCILVIC
uniref:Uncharacterized protein n=1 Tax=Cebus imitator TaxID=2715852 RepID=A0A2K5QBG9_CEBIM